MSQLLRDVQKYCDDYGLPLWDRCRMFAHAPLFKLAWSAWWSTGPKKNISRRLLKFFRNYHLDHTITTRNQKKLTIPVTFDFVDIQLFSEIFWGGEYESSDLPKNAKTFVDLGANKGMASLFFFAHYPLERALVVEANPQLAPILKSNLQLDFNTQIAIENVCVAGRSGNDMKFHIYENHLDSSFVAIDGLKSVQEVSVKAVALRELLSGHGFSEVDILKMDIEGAEHDIIAQDPEIFKKFGFICMEVHGNDAVRKGFLDKLSKLGFEVLERREAPHDQCEAAFARRVS